MVFFLRIAFVLLSTLPVTEPRASASGMDPDPVRATLERAYHSLRARNYDDAISAFESAVALTPERANIRKDLAYAYLKVGQTLRARDQFAEAMRLDPEDTHVALEYAFLCFETKHQAVARRVFDRLRRRGNQTAEAAFQKIDNELAVGIARWTRAAELSPSSYSVHHELARLAEQRDDLALAAKHYHRAWQLRPDLRAFLLDLGRVWKALGNAEQAFTALLAASRSAEPRVAEAARELLPSRYPYVYEFQRALALDPRNLALRRELAYLHLAMGNAAEAEGEFRQIVQADGADALSSAQLGFLLLQRKEMTEGVGLLERALKFADGSDDELADRIRTALGMPRTLRKRADVPRSKTSAEARHMAQRSLEAGYLKDALKYLRIAHENDPADFDVIEKLGQTYNLLKDDRQAVEWFRLARKSPDPRIAADSSRAFESLHPAFARFRTSAWAFPMYSSRWRDVFAYSQLKTELMPNWPVQFYLSTRFAGDARRKLAPIVSSMNEQYLSESAVVFGLGASTRAWHGARAWVESGLALSYLDRPDTSRTRGDHRGGVSAVRTFGRNIGASESGLFFEPSGDFVYMSRFDRDGLLYLRGRGGYTLAPTSAVQLQFSWNLNRTTDTRRYQWANTVETGPGVRVHFRGMPQPLLFSIDAMAGRYTVRDPARPPQFTDLRIGLWYAFTR
jgi:Tfp pilus assembly protein PilF